MNPYKNNERGKKHIEEREEERASGIDRGNEREI